MWVDHLEPLLETGNVWLGGWTWPSGEHKGKTEINVTVVFPADQTATAVEAATAWNQHSYWTSDPNHPDGGSETETGGSGRWKCGGSPSSTTVRSHPNCPEEPRNGFDVGNNGSNQRPDP